jgi:hypothetical protein
MEATLNKQHPKTTIIKNHQNLAHSVFNNSSHINKKFQSENKRENYKRHKSRIMVGKQATLCFRFIALSGN